MPDGPRSWVHGARRDLVGDWDQLGGVVASVLDDGAGRGMRQLTVRSPGGLSYVVHVDRAMDVGWADHAGLPLAWASPVGAVHPALTDPADRGWHRTFGGGLVATCGTMQVGVPGRDGDEPLGLHGRVGALPARDVSHRVVHEPEGRRVQIAGRVVEGGPRGEAVEVRRSITSVLGGGSVEITDVVTNVGGRPVPHLYRHHVNLGWPLLTPGSRIHCDASEVVAADAASERAVPGWREVGPPADDPEAESLLVLRPVVDAAGTATVALDGGPPESPVRLRLTWNAAERPLLLLWKCLLPRTYVLALEPSTHDDAGRAAARAAGTLRTLAPGEQVVHQLTITVETRPGTTPAGSDSTDRPAASGPDPAEH